MIVLVGLEFAVYLFLMGLRAVGFPPCALQAWLAFGLEVALDLTGAALAAGLALDGIAPDRPGPESRDRSAARAYGFACLAFLSTAVSASNWQFLSQVLGYRLTEVIGTWLELEVNLPYVSCFAFAALCLITLVWRTGLRYRVVLGTAISAMLAAVILLFVIPELHGSNHPLQHQLLHVACFVVSSAIVGFGYMNLMPGAATSARLLAGGFSALAVSGFLFQLTELHPGEHAFETAMEVTWTWGQFAAVIGLLCARSEPR